MFESWKKFLKSKKRDNNAKRNNKKRFCETFQTLFDLPAKNAEQKIFGDRPETEKAKKENVAFLHEQRNARKMQMSTLDYESREKWQRKHQRVETENLKIPQALSSKTDKPVYLQHFSPSESETSGEEFSPCSSKRIYASNSNQTVSV